MTIIKFALGAAVVAMACAPIASARKTEPIQVTVKGDRLVFASIADYRRAVDMPSEGTQKQLAATLGLLKFNSYGLKQAAAKDKSASLVPDAYFAALLNPDLVIQIGDNLIRIDPAQDRVLVLPVKYESEYGDLLAGQSKLDHLQIFSAGDDVLGRLQAQTPGAAKISFCTQSGIGGRSASQPYNGASAVANFNRYGIYYSLSAEVTPYGSSGFSDYFDFSGGIGASQGYVYYKPRCQGATGYATTTHGSWHLTNQHFQSYQGSTNLNEVYFVFRIKTGQGVYKTANVGFRVNK